MRTLTGAILVALAIAGCSSAPGASASPNSAAAVRCVSQASPAGASASPAAPESDGYVAVVTKGQPNEQEVTVNPFQAELAVRISWDAATTGDVQLSLFSPSGNDYDSSTHDPAVIHQLDANGENLVIMKPDPGRWRIRLLTGASRAQVRVDVNQVPLLAPIAYVVADPDRGVAPLASQFTVSAQAVAGATITSYRWDFGDCTSPDTSQNPKHVYKLDGSYKVTVTVTDSNAQVGSASHDVFVSAYKHQPVAKFDWGFLDSANPNVLLVDPRPSTDVDGRITSWTWSFGDGTSESGKDVTHTYVQAGSYSVTLTVSDDGGSSASTCQEVTTGKFVGTPVACPG